MNFRKNGNLGTSTPHFFHAIMNSDYQPFSNCSNLSQQVSPTHIKDVIWKTDIAIISLPYLLTETGKTYYLSTKAELVN